MLRVVKEKPTDPVKFLIDQIRKVRSPKETFSLLFPEGGRESFYPRRVRSQNPYVAEDEAPGAELRSERELEICMDLRSVQTKTTLLREVAFAQRDC